MTGPRDHNPLVHGHTCQTTRADHALTLTHPCRRDTDRGTVLDWEASRKRASSEPTSNQPVNDDRQVGSLLRDRCWRPTPWTAEMTNHRVANTPSAPPRAVPPRRRDRQGSPFQRRPRAVAAVAGVVRELEGPGHAVGLPLLRSPWWTPRPAYAP